MEKCKNILNWILDTSGFQCYAQDGDKVSISIPYKTVLIIIELSNLIGQMELQNESNRAISKQKFYEILENNNISVEEYEYDNN